MKRLYLDYAAGTPVDERVSRAMRAAENNFGNPGALHRFGQEASALIFESRRIISEAIGAGYSEIIFTGSATEANNLALRGAVRAWRTLHAKPYTPNPRLII